MTTRMAHPDFSEIEKAVQRLAPQAVRTPTVRSDVLDERVGARVFLKLENMQVTGSFKFRGAVNRLAMIPEADRKSGVVACSSGNHAQGVAEAARRLGMPATIVMPEDAPALKLERTRRSGARIVLYNRETDDREAMANDIASQTGATFVHPFDDAGVIAGQATAGVELLEDTPDAPDMVIVPTSGGGLASGVALAAEKLVPDCAVVVCEPSGFDDFGRSLANGRLEENSRLSGSVCDALLAHHPGKIGFDILKRRKSGGVTVDDDSALRAVAFAFHELKQVVEPSGAAGLAAILDGRLDVRGKTIGVIISGGNIDPDMMARALNAPG